MALTSAGRSSTKRGGGPAATTLEDADGAGAHSHRPSAHVAWVLDRSKTTKEPDARCQHRDTSLPHARPPAQPRRYASLAPLSSTAQSIKEEPIDKEGDDIDINWAELKTVTVRDLTAGKKVVLFAVPGAFTPTCTQKHLPGFVARAGELRAKGVDTVACVSVNDAFVMRAWKESLGVGDEVLLLSDGNGELTRAMGVELDLSDKPVGLGVRSRRYALLADDGVVKVLNLEEGGAFTNSSAEDMLKAL
ncbi:Peroxiredoxin-2E-1, chloroplastic [Triticum urartu]|uniref:Glutaredoxin-dependent peroxiredoxin n=1 Tax=Triticum urartu TaxID=4572 RepID=M7Z441_TRIUA|nr:Peroxiredoxin-2E-1, chloroplastic [Triticum urartu]